MIRIEEILQPSRVLMGLQGANKWEVLREMTDRLAAMQFIRDSEEIYRLLVERESLMTTGVKRGFAFPHAFSTQFDQSFLTLGVIPGGVDYESLDHYPVEFIFLLLGPPNHQTVHLRILARVSRLMGQADMLEMLRSAKTVEAVMEVLNDTERRLTAYPYSTPEKA
jgi:mannitol/fructose-specific phosphotransferase system IIA component (Ntr-type)